MCGSSYREKDILDYLWFRCTENSIANLHSPQNKDYLQTLRHLHGPTSYLYICNKLVENQAGEVVCKEGPPVVSAIVRVAISMKTPEDE